MDPATLEALLSLAQGGGTLGTMVAIGVLFWKFTKTDKDLRAHRPAREDQITELKQMIEKMGEETKESFADMHKRVDETHTRINNIHKEMSNLRERVAVAEHMAKDKND